MQIQLVSDRNGGPHTKSGIARLSIASCQGVSKRRGRPSAPYEPCRLRDETSRPGRTPPKHAYKVRVEHRRLLHYTTQHSNYVPYWTRDCPGGIPCFGPVCGVRRTSAHSGRHRAIISLANPVVSSEDGGAAETAGVPCFLSSCGSGPRITRRAAIDQATQRPSIRDGVF